MPEKTRISISVEPQLLRKFDSEIVEQGYPSRSEAVKELMKKSLVKKEWQEGSEVAGAIVVVYDHHRHNLVKKLIDVQHDFGKSVISSQHVHLDHDNCLEIIVVKGTSEEILLLVAGMKAIKGLKHLDLVATTTGQLLS